MTNLIRLIFILSLLAFHGFAQTGEPVILSVTYQFKHINDLNKPDKPYQEEMILRVGKTESRYSSWTEELNLKKPANDIGGGNSTLVSGGRYGFVPTVFVQSKGIYDFDLLQYPALHKLSRVVKLGSSNYRIETNLPLIDWKIYQEEKKIGSYTCQKAIGIYSGRSYTVWFAPELPFRNGPWKLWGLPGLILEAKDNKGEVVFLFKELNKGAEKESTAARNARIVRVSEKAFEQASRAFEKDPVGVYQSQLPIGTTEKAQLAFIDDKGNFYYGEEGRKLYDSYKRDLKQRRNNPIEIK